MSEIAAVYAICVSIVYSWSILWFFWKVPSWLYFLNLGEIAVSLAYILAVNFLESLVVLLAPLILSILLPKTWFSDSFAARGSALVIAGLGYMMLIASQFQNEADYPTVLFKYYSLAAALGLIALFVFLAGKVSLLRKIIEALAERAVIFLFLSIPFSFAALLVVAARLVF